MEGRRNKNTVKGRGWHKSPVVIHKKPAAYKQPGEKPICGFEEVAKPFNERLPGVEYFVPPTRGSYLLKNAAGD